MIHKLENDELVISIHSTGAELCSIYSKKNTAEYLWQGDPSIWAGQAPVLFPIVGMLKDGKYSYEGQEFCLPKHGFIRHNTDLEISEKSHTAIKFRLSSSPGSIEIYPFHFLFEIEFELSKSTLTIKHTVRNSGGAPLYFSIGGHPAFNCPLYANEVYNDYSIEIKNARDAKSYSLNKKGLISKNTFAIFDNEHIRLHPELFQNDALIFKNIPGKKAVLKHNQKGAILSVTYDDFTDLGIWAKPKAPFICIEPWLGYADVEGTTQELITKEGIQSLAPKEVHNSTYAIAIL